MTPTIFYSKTELNERFQVMANFEIEGLKKYGSNCILTHKNVIYKNLNNYWVSEDVLNKIKTLYNPERTCF
jgi:hypothetical protein